MSDTNQKLEDDVLCRMLATPPTPDRPVKSKAKLEPAEKRE